MKVRASEAAFLQFLPCISVIKTVKKHIIIVSLSTLKSNQRSCPFSLSFLDGASFIAGVLNVSGWSILIMKPKKTCWDSCELRQGKDDSSPQHNSSLKRGVIFRQGLRVGLSNIDLTSSIRDYLADLLIWRCKSHREALPKQSPVLP